MEESFCTCSRLPFDPCRELCHSQVVSNTIVFNLKKNPFAGKEDKAQKD